MPSFILRTLSTALALLVSSALPAGAAPPVGWHHSLYVGGGGYWQRRARVEIVNRGAADVHGAPVAVRIGNRSGELALAGAEARAIRVCDEDGAELLYGLTGPDGAALLSRPVPESSTLILPADCPAGGRSTCYVYFDNPKAWAVPDYLSASVGVRNGGMETGSGTAPDEWQHDPNDPQHRTYWVAVPPHSGARCLKTVVERGAEPTWIATRQQGIHIQPGADYVFEGWVQAEAVDGECGWYIHVGSDQEPMMLGPVVGTGGGTHPWTKVALRFTAPVGATRASVGTVLRGTGTAWFDDASLVCTTPGKLTAVASPPEEMRLAQRVAPPGPRAVLTWAAPFTVRNFSDSPLRALAAVDVKPLMASRTGRADARSLVATDVGNAIRCYSHGDALLVPVELAGRSEGTWDVRPSGEEKSEQAVLGDYVRLLGSDANLVKNGDFTTGAGRPDDWPGSAEGALPEGAQLTLADGGLFGEPCVRISVPTNEGGAWIGWRQDVPVRPGHTYLYSAWVKCEDVAGGIRIHAHYRDAAGELCGSRFASAGGPLSGDAGWTLMSGTFTMPPDAGTFQLHLTMNTTGTVWHDGVLLAEVVPSELGPIESGWPEDGADPAVWPVNPIVKVFTDDPRPAAAPPARISLARGEWEPLQLAMRSHEAAGPARIEVDPPVHSSGRRLEGVGVAVVGYVPIDCPTNYYTSQAEPWQRRIPSASPACDGWPGLWPDPLLPVDTLELEPERTGAMWLTVRAPDDAPPGDYSGTVRLVQGDRALAEVPFTVHVWDFALPKAASMPAIYDLRIYGRWMDGGTDPQDLRRRFVRFMAERRLCPDRVWPEPDIRYEDGRVVADFEAYDRAAELYFDELDLPHSYAPGVFYLFGWAHPPNARFGQNPYEGEYPWDGVDRSKLRPEYRRAYQACLRAWWEHVKEKGWADRFTLYISDEPHFQHEYVVAQMKALCEMIHEVDPAIPVYSSTWRHVLEWDESLNVWGVGQYGDPTVEQMEHIRGTGARLWFTTDGQMCTDTPYCAIERLLPHYCAKYGVDAYEFWGISWLTYDPYEFGWHSFIHQSSAPGESSWVRYPNGDGFLAYPGGRFGQADPVSSIRLEEARDGIEDAGYLALLKALIARAAGDTAQAEAALAEAEALVQIPNAGGKYSTKILPDPDAVLHAREAVARAIESLGG
jgi:hypothetical protein